MAKQQDASKSAISPHVRVSLAVVQAMESGRVNPMQIAVLLAILSFTDGRQKSRSCWPSIAALAKRSHLSKRSVLRSIEALESAGLVSVERRPNKSNVYAIVDDPKKLSPPDRVVSGQSPALVSGQSPALVSGQSPDQDPIEQDPIEQESGVSRNLVGGNEAAQGVTSNRPDIGNLTGADLADPIRLGELHRQAVDCGVCSASESDQLSFFTAAAYAVRRGDQPERLFAKIIRVNRWDVGSIADVDAGRRLLRQFLQGPAALPPELRADLPAVRPLGITRDEFNQRRALLRQAFAQAAPA